MRGYIRVVLFIGFSFQELVKPVVSACVLAAKVVNNEGINHTGLRSTLVLGCSDKQVLGCGSDTNENRYVFDFHGFIVMLSQ